MPSMIAMLAFVPVMVILAFSVQWGSVASIHSSAERLPECRMAYIGYSFLMTVFAWLLYFMYATRIPLGFLLPLGASFALAGDFYYLQFELARHTMRSESLLGGILFFILTQIAYAAAFLARVPFGTLVRSGAFIPALAFFVAVFAALFVLRVWNAERPRRLMVASAAYSLALAFMVSVAVSAAIAVGGPWRLIALGAVSFAVSDYLQGETTVHGRHPAYEFQVPWLTYLIAQALILYGFALSLP